MNNGTQSIENPPLGVKQYTEEEREELLSQLPQGSREAAKLLIKIGLDANEINQLLQTSAFVSLYQAYQKCGALETLRKILRENRSSLLQFVQRTDLTQTGIDRYVEDSTAFFWKGEEKEFFQPKKKVNDGVFNPKEFADDQEALSFLAKSSRNKIWIIFAFIASLASIGAISRIDMQKWLGKKESVKKQMLEESPVIEEGKLEEFLNSIYGKWKLPDDVQNQNTEIRSALLLADVAKAFKNNNYPRRQQELALALRYYIDNKKGQDFLFTYEGGKTIMRRPQAIDWLKNRTAVAYLDTKNDYFRQKFLPLLAPEFQKIAENLQAVIILPQAYLEIGKGKKDKSVEGIMLTSRKGKGPIAVISRHDSLELMSITLAHEGEHAQEKPGLRLLASERGAFAAGKRQIEHLFSKNPANKELAELKKQHDWLIANADYLLSKKFNGDFADVYPWSGKQGRLDSVMFLMFIGENKTAEYAQRKPDEGPLRKKDGELRAAAIVASALFGIKAANKELKNTDLYEELKKHFKNSADPLIHFNIEQVRQYLFQEENRFMLTEEARRVNSPKKEKSGKRLPRISLLQPLIIPPEGRGKKLSRDEARKNLENARKICNNKNDPERDVRARLYTGYSCERATHGNHRKNPQKRQK